MELEHPFNLSNDDLCSVTTAFKKLHQDGSGNREPNTWSPSPPVKIWLFSILTQNLNFSFLFSFSISFLFLIISEKEWIIHLAIAKEHQTKLSEETLNRINFNIKMKTMSAGLNEHMGTYQYWHQNLISSISTLFFSTDLKHSNAGYAYPKSNLASSKKTQYSISRNVIQKRKGKSNKDKNHSETTETNETKGGGGKMKEYCWITYTRNLMMKSPTILNLWSYTLQNYWNTFKRKFSTFNQYAKKNGKPKDKSWHPKKKKKKKKIKHL